MAGDDHDREAVDALREEMRDAFEGPFNLLRNVLQEAAASWPVPEDQMTIEEIGERDKLLLELLTPRIIEAIKDGRIDMGPLVRLADVGGLPDRALANLVDQGSLSCTVGDDGRPAYRSNVDGKSVDALLAAEIRRVTRPLTESEES